MASSFIIEIEQQSNTFLDIKRRFLWWVERVREEKEVPYQWVASTPARFCIQYIFGSNLMNVFWYWTTMKSFPSESILLSRVLNFVSNILCCLFRSNCTIPCHFLIRCLSIRYFCAKLIVNSASGGLYCDYCVLAAEF